MFFVFSALVCLLIAAAVLLLIAGSVVAGGGMLAVGMIGGITLFGLYRRRKLSVKPGKKWAKSLDCDCLPDCDCGPDCDCDCD